jgi:hypothetical protein
MLVAELARVYSEYLKHGSTIEDADKETTSQRNHFVNTQISMHKQCLTQTSYEITFVDMYIEHVIEIEQEDDNNDTEADDVNTTIASVLESLFPVIIHKMCPQCWKSRMETSSLPLVTTPTLFWWKSSRKTPVDCPICNKILYHKEDYQQKPPYLQCDSPDLGDDNDKTKGEKLP